jgi:predicted PurR-regulated permease PerM
MSDAVEDSLNDQKFQRNMMSSYIQIAAVTLLIAYCLLIVLPFTSIIVWGIILAVAIYPLFLKLSARLGQQPKWAATLIVLVGLAILLVPGWLIVASTMDSAGALQQNISEGGLTIPPPREKVKEWPVVGHKVYEGWAAGSENLQAFLGKYESQVKRAGERLFHFAAGLLSGLLHFVASIVIAGAFLLFADKGYATSIAISERISPDRDKHLTDLSVATIRSVTNGVLGVALIQAVLAGIGFALIGVPAGGVLTVVVLVTAIIQIPAIIVMLPIIIWVFSFASGGAATLFAIYSIAVALSDNVLKPLLLGRGVDLPVLIVLLGAIGGMIQFGVIGLFIGAVVLGLGYRIMSDWIWHRGIGLRPEDLPSST